MNAIRLRQILLDALEHVPFYRHHWRQAGVDLTRVSSAVHLEFLPVVRKADLLAFPPEQRIDDRFLRALLRSELATGEPFELPLDKQAVSRRRWRFVRALLDVGYAPGERVMLITEPPFPTGAMFVRWTYVDRRGGDTAVFSVFARARPQVLYGPLSALVQLANCVLAAPEVKWRPRLVVSTAEQLTDANRALLESAFSARVADFYGLSELGLVGYSIPGLAGYKMIPRDFHVETLSVGKGTDLERLIVTDLGGGAMPLIRFDTDDLVRRDRSRRGAPIVQIGRHMESLKRVPAPQIAVA